MVGNLRQFHASGFVHGALSLSSVVLVFKSEEFGKDDAEPRICFSELYPFGEQSCALHVIIVMKTHRISILPHFYSRNQREFDEFCVGVMLFELVRLLSDETLVSKPVHMEQFDVSKLIEIFPPPSPSSDPILSTLYNIGCWAV
jgi:hypothetical protein